MLILSQNGQSLANLDNLSDISYSPDFGALFGYSFYGSEGCVRLGEYNESRAAEILKEIMQFYDDGGKVYIMPQE